MLHLFGLPLNKAEPLAHDAVLSLSKFHAVATPSEHKIVLGWWIDTQCLLITLPENKATAWSTSIYQLLDHKKAKHKALETLNGWLNHIGYIIPQAHHFMGRLHKAKYIAERCSSWGI